MGEKRSHLHTVHSPFSGSKNAINRNCGRAKCKHVRTARRCICYYYYWECTQNEVKLSIRLESIMQSDQKRSIPDCLQHLSLGLRMFCRFGLLNYRCLLEHFHCIQLAVIRSIQLTNEKYFAVRCTNTVQRPLSALSMLMIAATQSPLSLSHILSLSLSLCVLTAIFQVSLGYPVFIEAKDEGGGGDNWTTWSYKSCKAPVKSSPPTNQHPVFFTGRMPFLSHNQQCQSTEGEKFQVP